MATINTSTPKTLTASVKGQIFMIAVNGGSSASITGAQTGTVGPYQERKSFGPFNAGDSITVTVTAGTATVDTIHADGSYGPTAAPIGYDPIAESIASSSARRSIGRSIAESPALVGFDCKCDQTSGYALDQSGNGNHLRMGANLTTPWANAGYLTTAAAAAGFAFVPTSMLTIDLAVDSFWFRATVNAAAPGASTSIAGCADTSSNLGFYFSARTNGTILPIFNGAGGPWTGATAYNPGVYLDSTDHDFDLWYDAPTRSVFQLRDFKIVQIWENVVLPGASSVNSQPLCLGAAFGAASQTSAAIKFANAKFVVFRGQGLPINVPEFMTRFATNKSRRVTAGDFLAKPNKYVGAALVNCQSNETGTSDYPDTNYGYGRPQKDPVSANGTTGVTVTTSSMFPRLAHLAGLRGTWLTTMNTGLGSTSGTQYWCGMFVSWAAATTFSKGAYVIAGGNIYKFTSSTNATNTIGITAGSQPTWPGSGTVVDNEITWTYVRAATGADVAGTVLGSSNPLFDPNGIFATVKTNLDALPSIYTKIVMLSNGQTDKTVGATQAQYTASIVNAVNWALANGYKAFIGFTCNGTTAGLNTWLYTVGQPGKNAALASFAGNPNVFEGADLLASLGDLAVTAYAPGLLSDQLHMNSMARDLAANAWDAKLAAAGF